MQCLQFMPYSGACLHAACSEPSNAVRCAQVETYQGGIIVTWLKVATTDFCTRFLTPTFVTSASVANCGFWRCV